MARLLSALLLVLVVPAYSADTYVHPGGAFSIETPPGWTTHHFVTPLGYPCHLFTPDAGASPSEWARGIWVFPVPIPSDAALTEDSLATAATMFVVSLEPDLIPGFAAATEDEVAGRKAWRIPVSGKRVDVGDWRGEILILRGDGALGICYGAPPSGFEALRTEAARALGTIVAPVKMAPADEPPMPATTERVRDVVAKMTGAVPLIQILLRDLSDPENFLVAGSGSGFTIHADGWVVTNRHVVELISSQEGIHGGRTPYDPVRLCWDQTTGTDPVFADVMAVAVRWDLALLKIRGDRRDWPHLRLGSIEKAQTGDKVVVLGWPDPETFKTEALNVNEGTLNAIRRDVRGVPSNLRHSAKTTNGNSGGPLYDLDLGALVGAHNIGIVVHTKKGTKEYFYHGAVPVGRILEEFPQVAAIGTRAASDKTERAALIAWYVMLKRNGAAMMEIRRALSADPSDGLANAFAFRICQSDGDAGRAAGHFDLALADPDSHDLAVFSLGRALIERGQTENAREIAQEAIRLHPELPEGYLIDGHAHMLKGRFDEALALFQQAAQVTSGRCAEAETMQGIALMTRWIDRNPVTALPPAVSPDDALVKEARSHLGRSLAIWPYRNGISHVWLGIIAALGGDGQEAAAQIKLGIQWDPVDPEAVQDQEMPEDPEDPGVIIGVAWYRILNHEWARAINLLKSVGGVSGSGIAHLLSGSAYAGLAEEHKASGDAVQAAACVDEAGRCVAQALNYEPDASWAADALCVYGWYLFQKEKYDESKEAFRRALELKPGHKGASDALKAMGG